MHEPTESTAALIETSNGGMNCMEVWGGNRSTHSYIARPGLDIWIWSQSKADAKAGGSDLHLLSSCASGRITRMLLADVCGFESLFAEIAGQLRDLMRKNVNTIAQARFIRDMNRRLTDASDRGGLAATFIGTYFAPSRSLTICNAGNPLPLLFKHKTQQWSVLKPPPSGAPADSAPLGVVDCTEYQHCKMKLEVGDMLLAYTNSVSECIRPDGGLFGSDGLLGLVQPLDAHRPADFLERLAAQIKGEYADNLAAEDATLLLCRATDRPVPWRDNFLAPFRLLSSAADRTTLE